MEPLAEPAHKPLTMIWIPPAEPQAHAESKLALWNWRETWAAHIGQTWVTYIHHADGKPGRRGDKRLKVIVTDADADALRHLPPSVKTQKVESLLPVRGIVATVREVAYDYRGQEVIGSRHFAARSEVYPHRMHSGDGYERTYVTGRHKDTGKYVTLMMPTARLENARAVTVDDPIVLFEMYHAGCGWRGQAGDDAEIQILVSTINLRAARAATGA